MKCGMIANSAKEIGQLKEQWEWGLLVTGVGGEGTKFGKGLVGNTGGST